jgi:uncharacterized protein
MKLLYISVTVIALIALALGLLLYFLQERMIFFPTPLPTDYKFQFKTSFEEVNITTNDNVNINALLFKANQPSKGVIFYLHGNAGALDSWGELSTFYNEAGYDVFMPDYRGYGKSGGWIKNEEEFLRDAQLAYATLTKNYRENDIIVLGYSIGSGAAAYVASTNHPKLLILQAPYYSLADLVKHIYPMLPTFLLKYKFHTAGYLRRCTMPVVIFHGDQDEVIYYGSSLKLKKEFKPADTLITLRNQSHNGITENPEYRLKMATILRN